MAANPDFGSLAAGYPLRRLAMDRSTADSLSLARAFLALTDEGVAEPLQRSLTRAGLALVAVVVLAVAMPLTWMTPTARSLSKAADQPAATLGSWKAIVAAGDDEDDAAA